MKKFTKEELRDVILDNRFSEVKYEQYEHITDMKYMFSNCYRLKTIPLLDTSKVTIIDNILEGCVSLETAL